MAEGVGQEPKIQLEKEKLHISKSFCPVVYLSDVDMGVIVTDYAFAF